MLLLRESGSSAATAGHQQEEETGGHAQLHPPFSRPTLSAITRCDCHNVSMYYGAHRLYCVCVHGLLPSAAARLLAAPAVIPGRSGRRPPRTLRTRRTGWRCPADAAGRSTGGVGQAGGGVAGSRRPPWQAAAAAAAWLPVQRRSSAPGSRRRGKACRWRRRHRSTRTESRRGRGPSQRAGRRTGRRRGPAQATVGGSELAGTARAAAFGVLLGQL